MADPRIDIPKKELADFCRRYRIRRLSLFGSALREDFNADSDVDGTDGMIFKADYGRSHYNNPCVNFNPCEGDFDCDGDVDGNDASVFTEDFGRNHLSHPCLPDCIIEECNY